MGLSCSTGWPSIHAAVPAGAERSNRTNPAVPLRKEVPAKIVDRGGLLSEATAPSTSSRNKRPSVSEVARCQSFPVNSTAVGVASRLTAQRRATLALAASNGPGLPNSVRKRYKSSCSCSVRFCLLYTSDAADDLLCVDLGGRRIIKKKK